MKNRIHCKYHILFIPLSDLDVFSNLGNMFLSTGYSRLLIFGMTQSNCRLVPDSESVVEAKHYGDE